MKTVRVRQSPGTYCRNSSQRFRSSEWCSTKSPRTRSSKRSTTPANSTPTWSTPKKPDVFSTVSTATRSHRCCGARSARACPPAVCSQPRRDSLSTVNVSAWRSFRPTTGTSPRPSAMPNSSKRSSFASRASASHPVATLTTAASSPKTQWCSTRPQPSHSLSRLPLTESPARLPRSTPSRTHVVRPRRLRPQRCSKRPVESSSFQPGRL